MRLEKYKSIEEFCKANELKREDFQSMIARAALMLLTNVDDNFGGDTRDTMRIALALEFFFEMLEDVE